MEVGFILSHLDPSSASVLEGIFSKGKFHASVTELVDVQGLGSCAARCEGSSPSAGNH